MSLAIASPRPDDGCRSHAPRPSPTPSPSLRSLSLSVSPSFRAARRTRPVTSQCRTPSRIDTWPRSVAASARDGPRSRVRCTAAQHSTPNATDAEPGRRRRSAPITVVDARPIHSRLGPAQSVAEQHGVEGKRASQWVSDAAWMASHRIASVAFWSGTTLRRQSASCAWTMERNNTHIKTRTMLITHSLLGPIGVYEPRRTTRNREASKAKVAKGGERRRRPVHVAAATERESGAQCYAEAGTSGVAQNAQKVAPVTAVATPQRGHDLRPGALTVATAAPGRDGVPSALVLSSDGEAG